MTGLTGRQTMKTEEELEQETREAFDGAKRALVYDYMYMGTEGGRDNLEYMGFKHIETREYIKIPKCGIAFRKDMKAND